MPTTYQAPKRLETPKRLDENIRFHEKSLKDFYVFYFPLDVNLGTEPTTRDSSTCPLIKRSIQGHNLVVAIYNALVGFKGDAYVYHPGEETGVWSAQDMHDLEGMHVKEGGEIDFLYDPGYKPGTVAAVHSQVKVSIEKALLNKLSILHYETKAELDSYVEGSRREDSTVNERYSACSKLNTLIESLKGDGYDVRKYWSTHLSLSAQLMQDFCETTTILGNYQRLG